METKDNVKPRMPVELNKWEMEKYEDFFNQFGAISMIYHLTGIHRSTIYSFLKTKKTTLANKQLIDEAIAEVELMKK